MALSSDNKIDTNTSEDKYAKYMHCDICGSLCLERNIYININKERYLYAKAIRCSRDNKLFKLDFVYDTELPNKIDNNDIRERIRKHQQSAYACCNYEYFEIITGKLCNPMAGETFEQYKARYRKTRDNFYKELENGERRENNNN